jgi:hypothetical protein
MKFLAGVCAAIAISAVGTVATTFAEASAFGKPTADNPVVMQAPTTPQAPPTPRAPATPQVVTDNEKMTPTQQSMAKNLTEPITAVGCVRAWKPAPEDVTKNPESDKPGVAGIFLLTPLQSSPNTVNDVPTYLLTPTQIVNFANHLDDKVEVVGVAQTAPMPPTVQEIVTAPPRPENKPNALAMPRLTIKSLRKVSDSCP